MVDPKNKKLFTVIGIALLIAWIVGDFLLGSMIQNMKFTEARAAADSERSRQNFVGKVRSRLNSTGPNSTLVSLTEIRNATIQPVRIAGVLGVLLLLVFSPIPEYLRLTKTKGVPPPSSKLTIGTAFSLAGVLALGIAQIVASNNLVTVSRIREFSEAEKRMDLNGRTMRNPPGHLVPPGYNPSNVSIVYGSERVETEKVSEIDVRVVPYVWVARFFGGVMLLVGLVSVMIGTQIGPPAVPPQPKADPPADEVLGKTEG